MHPKTPASLPLCLLLASTLFFSTPLLAKKKDAPPAEQETAEATFDAAFLSGLGLREIGPALTSGRVVDLAVHPGDDRVWYVASAAGGVWKTVNAGTTWTPIFDGEGSSSIGVVKIDPNNPHVVWVGTGENNSQRSVGYGDGVYKSLDDGASWTRVGLEASEHVGGILIDPRDSDVVYVAAQGPLWSAGGDRGLYKTVDGGVTWEKILEISEHTGVSEVHFDPRDPDTLYAVAYQRRRHVWGLLNGGPESAIHKSTDGGATWRKISSGLPSVDLGRIGMAVSPVDPDVLYAIVEAARDEGGFYRSIDRGETWQKRSDYVSGSPQYYQELFADPEDVDRIYSMDVWMQVSDDGGKTWTDVGETYKHVDNHVLWIDPASTDHLVAGCDGGVYETFDRGKTWRFFANLPITQFYKIAVDNDAPFYNVYGGTQDNFTLGGPSRTLSNHGILNSDWFVTLGGDGFQSQVDPNNPDIVYSQLQYGNLVRYDRRTGEMLDIKPQPEPGEDAPRWNWDAPLLISPHRGTRLYFANQRLYRSDDRGESWRSVSEDLTRQIDRNHLEMMGRVWEMDAVSRNSSTSPYGNLVALEESPLVEDLLYVGSDDGLVQVGERKGESGGEALITWHRVETFPGVPEHTYVNDLAASSHDSNVVYAAFNNHKRGDFKPYLLRSADRGRSWTSIVGDLPERGSIYTVIEDPERAGLLFVGTESGVHVTFDGGVHWIRLGLPTVAVRDLAIQEREKDLVVGTFGRGIWILDDITPLRALDTARVLDDAMLHPARPARIFVNSFPLGVRGKSMQGDAFYAAPNPPLGATLTYSLPESLETRREARWKDEELARQKGVPIEIPDWETLRAEEREEKPSIVLTLRDADGAVIRRLSGPVSKGFHRITWDLRHASPEPTSFEPPSDNPFASPPMGPMVAPGTYRVELSRRVGGEETSLGEPISFDAEPLELAVLPPEDRRAVHDFQRRTAHLQRAVLGAIRAVLETEEKLPLIQQAIEDAGADPALRSTAREIELRLADLRLELLGDRVKGSYAEPTSPSIAGRVGGIVEGHWTTTSAPTRTQERQYEIAAEAFEPVLAALVKLVEQDLTALEQALDDADAAWTPGRLPRWERD